VELTELSACDRLFFFKALSLSQTEQINKTKNISADKDRIDAFLTKEDPESVTLLDF